MKHLFLIFSFLLLTQISFGQAATLEGTMVDSATNEGLISANITIYKTGKNHPITGEVTDIDGNYSIDSLTYGIYDIEFSYVGYETQWLYRIQLNKNYIQIDIKLSEAKDFIGEIFEVILACPPLISVDKTTQGRVYAAEDIKRMPIKW